MTSSDLWDAETAEHYDETSAFMFAPEVLEPAVRFLAELAGEGPVLELAIGTGRVAIPLVERGVPVSGIELSQPMVDKLREKRTDIPVVVGDMATSTVPGQFSLVYIAWNGIGNLRTQGEQVACFRNAARHLAPGDDSSSSCGSLASDASRPVRKPCPSTSGNDTSASTRTT